MKITESTLRKIVREEITRVVKPGSTLNESIKTEEFGPIEATLEDNGRLTLTLKPREGRRAVTQLVSWEDPEVWLHGTFVDLPRGFEDEAEEALDWATDWYMDDHIDDDYRDIDDPYLDPYR